MADLLTEVDGRQLKLTNLDKVLWPESGFTKGQLVDYYDRIADVIIPHLRERPLTLKRYPNGVAGESFFEKNCPRHAPDWVATYQMGADAPNLKSVRFCLADDRPTLVWIANLAAIELHPLLATTDDIFCPSVVVFDLDPGEPATVVKCCEIALTLRTMFANLGLECFPKTSGSKGLQVYLPLNTPTTYSATKLFAEAIARLMEKNLPEQVVAKQSKSLRKGKVLIDWAQNNVTKTTVAVYSIRARPQPTVSTPLLWEEVAGCAASRDPQALVFGPNDVFRRVQTSGDLFEPVLTLTQQLPTPAELES